MSGNMCQRFVFYTVMAAAASLLSPGAHALSETRTFFVEKIYSNRPQLCAAAGTGCGKPAADAWCQQVGYQSAMSFRTVWSEDAEKHNQLVEAGMLCAKDACNGFHFVKCRRATP